MALVVFGDESVAAARRPFPIRRRSISSPLKVAPAEASAKVAENHGALVAGVADPNQAALPGGKADFFRETAFETARREANEEIGLPALDQPLPAPFRVEHLCELPANLSVTEIVVRPCVALLHSHDAATGANADPEDAFMPRLDAKEVAAVFTGPFHNFLKSSDEARGAHADNLPGSPTDWYEGVWTEWTSAPWRMHNFFVPITNQKVIISRQKSWEQDAPAAHGTPDSGPQRTTLGLERYRVFGLTARILVDAARVAYGETPEFEHNSQLGDEDMIWRLTKLGRFAGTRDQNGPLTKEVFRRASKLS
ncbi:8-oxo-dGTP diphosphatase [Ophidiomyces ophidiicola]|nr:8-oxo-dGTP diphosphatase [Ophidiomyces ophidiicola]